MTTTPDVYLTVRCGIAQCLQTDNLAGEEVLSFVPIGSSLFAGERPAGFTVHQLHDLHEAVIEGGRTGVKGRAVIGEDDEAVIVLVFTGPVVMDVDLGEIGDAFEEEITVAGGGDHVIQLLGAVCHDGDLLEFAEFVLTGQNVDGVGFLGVGVVDGRHSSYLLYTLICFDFDGWRVNGAGIRLRRFRRPRCHPWTCRAGTRGPCR